MNWTVKYIDYKTAIDLDLSDKNHISVDAMKDPYLIYSILCGVGLSEESEVSKKKTLSTNIESWDVKYGKQIIVFYVGDEIKYWMPVVELQVFIKYIKKYNPGFKFGYVVGTHHPMKTLGTQQGLMSASMNKGYDLWIQGI